MSTKQTSANNALLQWAKRQYNGKVYEQASKLLNTSGTDAAISYLIEFVRPEVRVHRRGYLSELASRNSLA